MCEVRATYKEKEMHELSHEFQQGEEKEPLIDL